MRVASVYLSLIKDVRNCISLEKSRVKAQAVHFTRGRPFWTNSNEIVYKLYLTSPKKCTHPLVSSFHVMIHRHNNTGLSFPAYIMCLLPVVLVNADVFFKSGEVAPYSHG